jgi:hypothetical protein
MNKEILEGNKAIMLFDGAERTDFEIIGEICKAIKYKDGYYPENKPPQFHKDWNLLMPVVEKVASITNPNAAKPNRGFGYEISNCHCWIYSIDQAGQQHEISNVEADFTIEAVWQAVVQFIQWYNKSAQ